VVLSFSLGGLIQDVPGGTGGAGGLPGRLGHGRGCGGPTGERGPVFEGFKLGFGVQAAVDLTGQSAWIYRLAG
jgi:hypothetical protein